MINNRYKINKFLGEGRSKVYQCQDAYNDYRQFAIKLLPPDTEEEEVSSFENEYYILRSLEHPNIIKAYQRGKVFSLAENDGKLGIEKGSKFLILEYFNGKPLSHFINPEEQFLKSVLYQLGAVLFYLHQSNLVYSDLKPENILVNKTKRGVKLKFIDFGMINCFGAGSEIHQGTAEYLAPEIIKNDNPDHRADLYSLGVILYQMIYGSLPFSHSNELEIYKAHISADFQFEKTNYSADLIETVKNLVNKNPNDRPESILEVLGSLQIPLDHQIKKDWIPPSFFIHREDIQREIEEHLKNSRSAEIKVIKGIEGSGKSSLLNNIESQNKNTFYFPKFTQHSELEFWIRTIRNLTYSDFVYPKLDEKLLKEIDQFLSGDIENLNTSIRSIFNKISLKTDLILLIDDFEKYADSQTAIINEIIPLIIVNDSKVILTENPNNQSKAKNLHNINEFHIAPFTENELEKFLESSFSNEFPKLKLKSMILEHSDMLPGSIREFIKDLVINNVIEYSREGIQINQDTLENQQILKSSQQEIFKSRLKQLTPHQLETAQLLSAFNILPSEKMIQKLLISEDSSVSTILSALKDTNIINYETGLSTITFTSSGLKDHIYETIENKKEVHRCIAEILNRDFPDFNIDEIANHYEKAGLLDKSYEIYKKELNRAESISANLYKKSILKHLSSLELNRRKILEINIDLVSILSWLGEKKEALKLIDSILENELSPETREHLLIEKGNCLIELKDVEEGKELLSSLLPSIKDNEKRNEILLNIAYAELNHNNYQEAKEIVDSLLGQQNLSPKIEGESYNLLGMYEFYRNQDLEEAVLKFERALYIYEQADLRIKVSKITVNIGAMFAIMGEREEAKNFWDKASELNESIGDLDQEAKLLMNYGIHFYDELEFERAIDYYKKAEKIFISIGDYYGRGLILINIGETYLEMCEYEYTLSSLLTAKSIFKKAKNVEDETATLFLLGRLYYKLGDKNSLEQIINEYKNIIENENLTPRHKIHHKYLEQLSKVLSKKYVEAYSDLSYIMTEYELGDSKEDANNFARSGLIFSEICIKTKRYEEAYETLMKNQFMEICEQNKLFQVERLYWLAKLSARFNKDDLKTPIEYIEKAYNLLESMSINEHTWKVLVHYSEILFVRGNFNRAKIFVSYAKSLLNFVAENFGDKRLKKIYFDNPDRKQALETLNNFETQIEKHGSR